MKYQVQRDQKTQQIKLTPLDKFQVSKRHKPTKFHNAKTLKNTESNTATKHNKSNLHIF